MEGSVEQAIRGVNRVRPDPPNGVRVSSRRSGVCVEQQGSSSAYMLTIIVAQVWRVASEMLRADYRGEGRLTAYQKLALFGIVYAIGLGIVFLPVIGVTAEISAGIAALWNPLVIVVLQGLWAVLFIVTGWVLSFHVHRDRV